MVRFSANLGFMWADLPLLRRIEAAASAGFRAIELQWPYDTPAKAVADLCAKHELKVLCLNTPLGDAAAGEFGLGAVPGREAEFAEGVEMAIAYARTIGAGAFHAMTGVVGDNDPKQAWRVARHNLAAAAQRAGDSGLTMLLELINPKRKAGYFFPRLEPVQRMMEELASPHVRMMFDVHHVAVAQGDVIDNLRTYLPLIGHIQIAAVPSRHEPDEGEINYRAIFDEIDRLGYQGWIGCEYIPRGSPEAGLDWVKSLGVSL